MLLKGPGTWDFVLGAGFSSSEFASVTTPSEAVVRVLVEAELIDEVFVRLGQSHTWWNSNPLFSADHAGKHVRLVIEGEASMRVEWPLKATE